MHFSPELPAETVATSGTGWYEPVPNQPSPFDATVSFCHSDCPRRRFDLQQTLPAAQEHKKHERKTNYKKHQQAAASATTGIARRAAVGSRQLVDEHLAHGALAYAHVPVSVPIHRRLASPRAIEVACPLSPTFPTPTTVLRTILECSRAPTRAGGAAQSHITGSLQDTTAG